MGFNYQYVSIGSDNGLVSSRQQAIIWTNVNPFHWRKYAALGGDKLNNLISVILTCVFKGTILFYLLLKDFYKIYIAFSIVTAGEMSW